MIAGSPNHWMGRMVMGFTAMMLEAINTVMKSATTMTKVPVNRITASDRLGVRRARYSVDKKSRG